MCIRDRFGLDDRAQPDPDAQPRAGLAELLARNEALWTHARPVMETLREQIAGTDSMVLLTDSAGTVLHTLGDDEFLSKAERVALRPGVLWSEQRRGTNAIGTALAERSAVQIHGHEHYLRANHILTCSCAPIRDPMGQVIGALDVSGDHRAPHKHTLALVRMSAQMVENHLFAKRFAHSVLLHFHTRGEFIDTLVEGLAAFEPDGRFLSANQSGQFQLGLPLSGLQSHTFGSLFGVAMPELLEHARRHGTSRLRLQMHNGVAVQARVAHERSAARIAWADSGWDEPGAAATADRQGTDTGIRSVAPRAESRRSGLALAPANRAVAGDPLHRSPSTASHSLSTLDTGDAQMAQCLARARKVLDQQDVNVLILGETGTGKELLAHALHAAGARRQGPFVAVNCASIPETLIESELFGYEDGAFTGARRKGHAGKILQAQGGTLFLDEIGDMPLAMQARLLRVLQEQSVTPLGGSRDVALDVRVLSATHRNLKSLMAQGLFREDLYYRLNGLTLKLPALRERSDLQALIDALLAQHGAAGMRPPRLAPDVARLLLGHAWPGNIRQLANVLRSATLMADAQGWIERGHLPDDFLEELQDGAPPGIQAHGQPAHPAHARPGRERPGDAARALDSGRWGAAAWAMDDVYGRAEDGAAGEPMGWQPAGRMRQITHAAVHEALARNDHNVSAAARELGVSRNTVYRYSRN